MRKSDAEDLSQDGATGIVKSIGVERNPNDALINDSIAVRVEITLKMHPGMIYFVRLTQLPHFPGSYTVFSTV